MNYHPAIKRGNRKCPSFHGKIIELKFANWWNPFQIPFKSRFSFRSIPIFHGSWLMSPLNITQPLGIWSIMATIRWCPIYPKWDSYQPHFSHKGTTFPRTRRRSPAAEPRCVDPAAGRHRRRHSGHAGHGDGQVPGHWGGWGWDGEKIPHGF